MTTTNQTTALDTNESKGVPAFLDVTKRPAKTEPSKPVATEVKSDKPDHTAKIAAAVEKSKARNAAKVAKQAEPKASKPKQAKPAKEPVADTDPETGEQKVPRSVVPGRYKTAYAEHNNTCGDKLGLALKKYTFTKDGDGRDSIDLTKLGEVAKANGIAFEKYAGLNNGMKRMNVSNKLRGMLKHGEKVTIGSQVFAKAETALAKAA